MDRELLDGRVQMNGPFDELRLRPIRTPGGEEVFRWRPVRRRQSVKQLQSTLLWSLGGLAAELVAFGLFYASSAASDMAEALKDAKRLAMRDPEFEWSIPCPISLPKLPCSRVARLWFSWGITGAVALIENHCGVLRDAADELVKEGKIGRRRIGEFKRLVENNHAAPLVGAKARSVLLGKSGAGRKRLSR